MKLLLKPLSISMQNVGTSQATNMASTVILEVSPCVLLECLLLFPLTLCALTVLLCQLFSSHAVVMVFVFYVFFLTVLWRGMLAYSFFACQHLMIPQKPSPANPCLHFTLEFHLPAVS